MHLANDNLRPDRPPLQSSSFKPAEPLRPRWSWYPPIKFAIEWAFVCLMIIPAGTLIGLFGLLVKLTSPGRVLYRQKRVGLGGQIFTMIKLRTMKENSEAGTGPVWSQPGDPRVTKIGRLLRDTHMDELPQLWNVLRGEMSLIGPRPERPEIVARLERSIPNYHDRVGVRPGLTGLAQVQLPPDSDDTSVKRKLAYDRYYVEQLSPWLDARIAASTFFYFSSVSFKALCHLLVRSYGRDIEETFIADDQSDDLLSEESEQTQPA